jgi:hypothetical protein
MTRALLSNAGVLAMSSMQPLRTVTTCVQVATHQEHNGSRGGDNTVTGGEIFLVKGQFVLPGCESLYEAFR